MSHLLQRSELADYNRAMPRSSTFSIAFSAVAGFGLRLWAHVEPLVGLPEAFSRIASPIIGLGLSQISLDDSFWQWLPRGYWIAAWSLGLTPILLAALLSFRVQADPTDPSGLKQLIPNAARRPLFSLIAISLFVAFLFIGWLKFNPPLKGTIVVALLPFHGEGGSEARARVQKAIETHLSRFQGKIILKVVDTPSEDFYLAIPTLSRDLNGLVGISGQVRHNSTTGERIPDVYLRIMTSKGSRKRGGEDLLANSEYVDDFRLQTEMPEVEEILAAELMDTVTYTYDQDLKLQAMGHEVPFANRRAKKKALISKAWFLISEHRFQEAGQILEQIQTEYSDSLEPRWDRTLRFVLLHDSHRFAELETVINKELNDLGNSDKSENIERRAHLLSSRGMTRLYQAYAPPDGAKADFVESVRLLRHARTMNNLGHWYMMNGDTEIAASWFRDALTVDAKDAYANNNLSSCLNQRGHYWEALWHSSIALLEDDNYFDARMNRAMALLELGLPSLAAMDLEHTVGRDSDQSSQRLHVDAYTTARLPQQAFETSMRYLSRSKENIFLYWLVAEAALSAGHYEEAYKYGALARAEKSKLPTFLLSQQRPVASDFPPDAVEAARAALKQKTGKSSALTFLERKMISGIGALPTESELRGFMEEVEVRELRLAATRAVKPPTHRSTYRERGRYPNGLEMSVRLLAFAAALGLILFAIARICASGSTRRGSGI